MRKIFLLLLLPITAMSQKKYPVLLDSLMHAEVSVNHFNGNVLVAKSGKIIYHKAYGYKSCDFNERLDNNTIFELASITKQFTAVGILQLKNKGRLKLSDSLRKFFPELPYYNITIQHLLTHTSGLPEDDEILRSEWNGKHVFSNNDLIRELTKGKASIHFNPGEKWEYSNTGFELLASIIEKVSGQTYKAYMHENLFAPLNMKHTRVYTTRRSSNEIIPNYAFPYTYSDSLQRYLPPDSLPEHDYVIYLDGLYGAGGISSTTDDLFKWDRAMKSHTLLNAADQKTMFSAQSVVDTASKRYYGYGEFIGENELGSYIEHGGAWPGCKNMLVRYTVDDITIITLSNNDETDYRWLAGKLAYIIKGRQVVPPYIHKAVAIDTALYDQYVGEYIIPNVPNPTKIELLEKDGKLMCRFEKQIKEMELQPESSNKFFANNFDMQIEFEIGKSGKPTKSFVIFNSMKKEVIRLK